MTKEILNDGKRDLTILEIMEILPHRGRYLLLSQAFDLIPGKSVTAVVGISPEVLEGHVPGFPILRGTDLLEMMTQACGLISHGVHAPEDTIMVFSGTKESLMRRPVVSGDQLIIKAEYLKTKKTKFAFFNCKAYVGRKLVADGVIRGTVMTKKEVIQAMKRACPA